MSENKHMNITKLMQCYTSICAVVNQYFTCYAKDGYSGSSSKLTFWGKLQGCL